MKESEQWANAQKERLLTLAREHNELHFISKKLVGMIEGSQHEDWWDELGEAFNQVDAAMGKIQIEIEQIETKVGGEQ